ASKLSVHLIMRYTPGARAVVAAGPRVLKLLDLHDDMRAALGDYKARFPRGLVVLRVYTRQQFAMSDDPAASAAEYWRAVLAPAVLGKRSLSRAGRIGPG
ncbi:MAG: hypothetical protein C4321_08780, partial [Chloroflexota bacterium]